MKIIQKHIVYFYYSEWAMKEMPTVEAQTAFLGNGLLIGS